MKTTLKPGVTHTFSYQVPCSKLVPSLYPEAQEFQEMPEVFATGFMVGLMEWTCIQLLKQHLDKGEGSLGTHIDVSHLAPTPEGFTVTVEAQVAELDGRRVWFEVRARDDQDLIGVGRHQRTVVAWDQFNERVAEKAKSLKQEA